MYAVSDQYKTDIQKPIRNPSHVEIAHVIANDHNVGTFEDPTIFPTGMFESEINQYFVRQVQSATFEPLGCILDGGSYLRGTPTIIDNNESAEYVSTAYSIPDFTAPDGTVMELDSDIYITEYDITTTQTFSVAGHLLNIELGPVSAANKPTHVFLKFDTINLIRPTAFTINMVDNDPSRTVLATADYTPTEFSGTFLLPTLTDLQAVQLTDIEIIVTAINMPYQYVRFEKVILGIVNEFDDNDISDCEWNTASNPLTFEVPKASFDFTFLDPDRLYHESNPDSLLSAIKENQQVGFRFGYELDSGGTEWVTCGLYRTTGEVLTDDSGIPRVTVKTAHASVIADDLVREINSTLVSYDDAEVAIDIDNVVDMMDDVGVTATLDFVDADSNLVADNFTTTVTVVDKNMDIKNYTQLMMNAHGMMWLVKRDSPYSEEMLLREFAKLIGTDEHDYDTIGFWVDDLSAQTNYYTVSSVPDTNIRLFQFNNDSIMSPPNIGIVPKSDGIDYARYNIDTNETERKPYPDPAVGSRLVKIDNTMVTTQGTPSTTTKPNDKIGEYISKYYGEQNTYSVSNRGFPELDVGDIVQILSEYYDTTGESVLYTLDVQGLVVSNKIKYNGSIKGETSIIGWQTIIDAYA